MLSILISISLFFFIEDLLKMLISVNWDFEDYKLASKAIILMSIAMTIGIPQFVSRAVMQGVGLHWSASIGKVVASFIAFGTGLVLMWFDLGLIGASLGWCLIWILPGIFYFPKIISKFMNIKIRKMLVEVYLPGIYTSVLLILTGYLLTNIFNKFELLEIILSQFVLFILALCLIFIYNKKFILEIKVIKSLLMYLRRK